MRSPEFIGLARSIVFSASFLGLIAAAVGGIQPAIASWALLFVVALVVIMNVIIQHSTFLSIVLANFVGLFACSFTFFVEEQFTGASALDIQIAFALPLFAFTLGIYLQRRKIEHLIQRRQTHIRTDLSRSTPGFCRWLQLGFPRPSWSRKAWRRIKSDYCSSAIWR